MKENNSISILLTLWIFVWVYDLVFALPDNFLIVVLIGWLVTILAILKWSFNSSSNLYIRIASVIVIGFVIFATFGNALDFLTANSPKFDERYQRIILIIVQSVLASIFTAVLVAVPLVSIHRSHVLSIIILACLPTIILQLNSILNISLTFKLVILFEIVFRVLAIWCACLLATWSIKMSKSSRTGSIGVE